MKTRLMVGVLMALSASALADPGRYGQPGDDVACPECGGNERIGSTQASSTLTQGKVKYAAKAAFDGKPKTAWCEGAKGDGAGQSLTITLEKPQRLVALQVHGGYFKDARVLAANGRVARLRVEVDGGKSTTLELADPAVADSAGKSMTAAAWFTAARKTAPIFQPDAWSGWGATRTIKLTVVEAYAGGKFQDTCISDVAISVQDP